MRKKHKGKNIIPDLNQNSFIENSVEHEVLNLEMINQEDNATYQIFKGRTGNSSLYHLNGYLYLRNHTELLNNVQFAKRSLVDVVLHILENLIAKFTSRRSSKLNPSRENWYQKMYTVLKVHKKTKKVLPVPIITTNSGLVHVLKDLMPICA